MTQSLNDLIHKTERAYFTCITLCAIVLCSILSVSDKSFVIIDGTKTSTPLNISLPVHATLWILPITILLSFLNFIYYFSSCFDQSKKESLVIDSDKLVGSSVISDYIYLNQNQISYYSKILKKITIELIIFGLPVFILFVVWAICLKKHSYALSFFQSLLFWLTISCLVFFKKHKRIINNNHYYAQGFLCLFISVFMIFIPPYFIFEGKNYAIEPIKLSQNEVVSYFPLKNNPSRQYWFGKLLEPCFNYLNQQLCNIGYNPFVSFRTEFVSSIEESSEINSMTFNKPGSNVVGAELSNVNLQGCDAERAYFVRSNLRNTNLSNSYLRGADFSFADLRNVNLSNSYIRIARFNFADLRKVNFNNVMVEDFGDPTPIFGPNFQGAKFNYKDFNVKDNFFFPYVLMRKPYQNQDLGRNINQTQKPGEDDNQKPDSVFNMYYSKNLPLAYFGIESKSQWVTMRNSIIKRIDELNKILNKENLQFHDFSHPFITDTELRNKKLKGKVFNKFYSLEDSDFTDHDLTQSSFAGVRLKGAIFTETKIDQVNFSDADLRESQFKSVDFTNVIINDKTDFTGASFTNCKACNCEKDKCINDSHKKLRLIIGEAK